METSFWLSVYPKGLSGRSETASQNAAVFSRGAAEPAAVARSATLHFEGGDSVKKHLAENSPALVQSPIQFTLKKPLRGKVRSVRELTRSSESDVKEIVIDVSGKNLAIRAGQCIAVKFPKETALEPRFYSVGGIQRDIFGNVLSITLCVKRSVQRDPAGKIIASGSGGSEYLCNLAAGASLEVIGPFGETLTYPSAEIQKPNLILIATGTGLSPFLPLLGEIYGQADAPAADLKNRSAVGQLHLLVGAYNQESLLYDQALGQQARKHRFTYLTALEQEDGERVDTLIRQRARMFYHLLKRPDTVIYLCGIPAMEKSVIAALQSAAEDYGLSWEKTFEKLKTENRWRIENGEIYQQYLAQAGLLNKQPPPTSFSEKLSALWKRFLDRLLGLAG